MPLPRDIASSGERPRTIADEQQRGELQIAWGHAMWRNNLVAKVFCYLSVMRAAGLIHDGARVLISPASLRVPQDFNASNGNQAAHYLPGFVAIGDSTGAAARYMWDLASGPAREEVAALFRATQDLPASYNRADSAAEGKVGLGPAGLKQIFGTCCQLVVDQKPPKSRMSGKTLVVVDRPLVLTAWREWSRESIAAYERAAGGKDSRIAAGRPAGVRTEPVTDVAQGKLHEWTPADIKARTGDLQRTVSGRKSPVSDFQDQASFLRAYAVVTGEQFPLSDAVINQIETAFAPKMPSWYER